MSYNMSFGDVRAQYGQETIDALIERASAKDGPSPVAMAILLPEWTFEEWAHPLWCQLVAWSPSGELYVLAGHSAAEQRWSGPFVGGVR